MVIVGVGGKWCDSWRTLKVELICCVDRCDYGWLMDMNTLAGETVIKDAEGSGGGGAAL